jgi:hypothetical protein
VQGAGPPAGLAADCGGKAAEPGGKPLIEGSGPVVGKDAHRVQDLRGPGDAVAPLAQRGPELRDLDHVPFGVAGQDHGQCPVEGGEHLRVPAAEQEHGKEKAMTGKSPPGRPHRAGRPDGDSQTRSASGMGTAHLDSPPQALPVAFYWWSDCAAGTCDNRADQYQQLALCQAVAAARGWQVTAEFFDEDCRAGYSWQRRPQGRALLAALSESGHVAGAVAVANLWCPLPRRAVPGDTAILARFAFRQVLLVLAGTGMVTRSAEEYGLLGRLLSGLPCGVPRGGNASRLSVRDHRARGNLARQPALPRRLGEPR